MVVEDARAYLETLDLDREGLAIVLLKTNDSKTAMTVSRFSPFTTRKWNHW